jgi:hypothetical protein
MKITIETEELVIRGGVVYSQGEVVTEKPKDETCKWRTIEKSDEQHIAEHPHLGFDCDIQDFKFCPVCGKRIEVVQ